jgi:hypothetical protein
MDKIMPVYTVQAPADPLGEPAFEKSVFLREGFSWPAFIFGIFWLLLHQLWATAAAWFVCLCVLTWLSLTYLSFGSFLVIALAIHLWLGLEGNTLLRNRLARQNYKFLGVVAATGLEAAERSFFSRIQEETASAPPAKGGPPPLPGSPPLPGRRGGDVLGFFPEPEIGH